MSIHIGKLVSDVSQGVETAVSGFMNGLRNIVVIAIGSSCIAIYLFFLFFKFSILIALIVAIFGVLLSSLILKNLHLSQRYSAIKLLRNIS